MSSDAPLHFFRKIGEAVQEAIEDHETRCHIPPPNRSRLTAIPFADVRMKDSEVIRAVEMLRGGHSIEHVAWALDVPLEALERHLVEYRPRWRNFLYERGYGVG